MSTEWPSLPALELFVAVVEEGSVGAAARTVGMAQPNASRLLAHLESRLGTPLLERSPRGTRPTARGLLYADRAREVLASARRFVDWLQEGSDGATVGLRVGTSMTIAETLLPVWLAELKRRLPLVRAEVQVLNSARVVDEVQAGTLHLGFVETPHVPVRLNAQVVQEDELVVVVDPAHAWASRRGGVGPRELARTPLVVREQGSGTREALRELLDGYAPVEPAQTLGSNAAVRVAVAAGAGPAALSKLALRDQLASGELLQVPLHHRAPKRPLTAVWAGPRVLTGPAAELVAVAQAGH